MKVIYFREDGFGVNREEFGFVIVELEKVLGEKGSNFLKAID